MHTPSNRLQATQNYNESGSDENIWEMLGADLARLTEENMCDRMTELGQTAVDRGSLIAGSKGCVLC